MKKLFLSCLLMLAFATADAQPGGGGRPPMFGQMPQIDVKYDAYVAAPEGFDEKGIPCTLIEYPGGRHDFVVWKYGLFNFAQKIFK